MAMLRQMVSMLFVMYSLFVIAVCMVGGVLKEEWFIDGEAINNVCDILRAIVVDDTRKEFAIVTVIAIIPVAIYGALHKFRLIFINISLLLFCSVWLWNYIYKYRDCLWF